MTEDKLKASNAKKAELDNATKILDSNKRNYATFRISRDSNGIYQEVVSANDIKKVIGDDQYKTIREVLHVLLSNALEESVSRLQNEFNSI